MQFRLQRHGVERGTGVVITVGIPTKILKDDECTDTKPSKNTPPSFRFVRLGNHTTRTTPNSNWTAVCNLFWPSIERSVPENIAGRHPRFRGSAKSLLALSQTQTGDQAVKRERFRVIRFVVSPNVSRAT
jgi:hypothetical protein